MAAAKLRKPSVIEPVFATLEQRLIIRQLGALRRPSRPPQGHRRDSRMTAHLTCPCLTGWEIAMLVLEDPVGDFADPFGIQGRGPKKAMILVDSFGAHRPRASLSAFATSSVSTFLLS